jgi:hypothetical protein
MRTIIVWSSLTFSVAFSAEPRLVKSVAVYGTSLRVTLATQAGAPYSVRVIEKDVRRLWSMGQFEDIRAEIAEHPDGVAVSFEVVEARKPLLREIRIEPSSFGLQLTLPEGTPMSRERAHEIANQARKQLNAQGYTDARVEYQLEPCRGNRVDLRLTIQASGPVRVNQVEFTGVTGLDPEELHGALRALQARRWRRRPAYSPEAVDSDLSRLRSLYLSKAYFDASVRVEQSEIRGANARIRFQVQSGSPYQIRNRIGFPATGDVCSCVLAERRAAQRQGILDFSVKLTVHRIDNESGSTPVADLTAEIERGRPYRVGSIDFTGVRHYKDSTIRRNFLLDEGELLDEHLLRKSIARLNRGMLFEPIDTSHVAIHPDDKTGVADVRIELTGRKGGAWGLSGPVGPMSFAGPLQASIRSRLPPWGSGMFELSTYTASVSLAAFARPILPLLRAAPKSRLIPVLALQRPFSPGERWKSGFSVAPRMGWRTSGLSYGATQIQQRMLAILAGDRGLETEASIMVEGPAGTSAMFCEPPKPRLARVRDAAAVGIQVLGSLSMLP